MGKNNCKAVWFNKKAVLEYEQLEKDGLTSQPFNDFVRAAYYNAFDRVKINQKKEGDINGINGDTGNSFRLCEHNEERQTK